MKILTVMKALGLAFFLQAIVSPALAAADYPNRPVKLVVPWAAGGLADTVARVLAEQLTASLGQQVFVENKSGASGLIGAQSVAKAAPDGYTLLVTPGELLTVRALLPAMDFDAEKEIVPVAILAKSSLVLVVNKNSPFKTLNDLRAYAAKEAVTYSSPSVGSLPHLAGEWLAHSLGVKLRHVPYKGGAPAIAAVLSGTVSAGISSVSSARPVIENGGRVLAVMSQNPITPEPSWPTLYGVADVHVDTWVALFAPASTPKSVLAKLATEVRRIAASEAVKDHIGKLDLEVPDEDIGAFRARIGRETKNYAPIVQKMIDAKK